MRAQKQKKKGRKKAATIKVLSVDTGLWGTTEVTIKLPRTRKARRCTVMPMGKKDGHITYILQDHNFIMEVDPHTKTAIYNLRCGYFPCLSEVMGARHMTVTQEFIDILEKAAVRKGDMLGVHPSGSPIYFGGAKEI